MKLLYIFLFIALPSAIFAQSNYHPGYIVKNNGDVVKGYIDYREWARSPVSIDFKINRTDKDIQQFTPANTKSFGIDSLETYISYRGLVSNDLNHFPSLAENLDTVKVQVGIFLRLITSGSHLSLYSQTDERKIRYFVSEGNAVPVELKYYQYYNDQHDAIERPFFRGQLLFYINKYNTGNTFLINKAREALFSETALKKVIDAINGEAANGSRKSARKSNIRFFVGAAALYNKTRFWEPSFTVVTETGSFFYNVKSYSLNVAPQINLGFDLFVNPDVQKLIFRTEVSVTSVSAQLSYPITDTKNGVLKFDQYIGSITPQLLYNLYNRDGFKIFIDAGAAANILKYANISFTDPTTGVSYPHQTDDFNNFIVSFPLQTGIMINEKVEVSFSYTPYDKFTSFPDFSISNHSFGVGIKLFLGAH